MNDTFYPQDTPQEPVVPQEPVAPEAPVVPQEPVAPQEPAYIPDVTREPIGMQPPVYDPTQDASFRRPYQPYYSMPEWAPPRPQMPPVRAYCPPPAPKPVEEEEKPAETKKEKKKKRGVWKFVLSAVALVLVGAICGGILTYVLLDDAPVQLDESTIAPTEEMNVPTTRVPTPTRPRPTVSGDEMTPADVYQANVPGIVGISAEATYNVFGQTSTSASSGTGFIISDDGEILTNYHVVEGANSLTVTLYNGEEYPATLVGYEAESDAALLKIDAQGLAACAIGDSNSIYVGQQIAAIGNPLGELTYTMTVGYVSAMDRFVNTDGTPINMMQVDAAINPGNSGGPIFNMYGEVIGIATAKYSGTLSGGATIEGIGFAIPINDVMDILDDLRNNGAVLDRAYMGVMVSTVGTEREELGIDYGVYVQSVNEGGSAYSAGVKAGDVIIAVGETKIVAYENLQQELRKYRAGDQSTLTVIRDGQTIQLPITFEAKPLQTEEPVPETTEPTTYYDPWGGFPFGGFGW